MNEIFENLPTSIHAFTRENEDGSYTIVYNSRMDYETLCRAGKHEMRHIAGDDLDRDDSADSIEAEVHRRR